MRRLMGFVLAALVFAAGPALADDKAEIARVIQDQTAALSEGDAHRAFGYATPAIQARFGSSSFFMSMVESSYSALIRPRDFSVEAVETDGDQGLARARVVASDGRIYDAVYPLARQEDGSWRIDGCYMRPAEGRSL